MNRAFRPIQLAHLVLLLAMLGLSAWGWSQLPLDARIPTHWNIDGVVDDTSGKAVGLLMLPGISLAVLALFSAIPAIEPRRRNLEASSAAYRVIWGGVALMFAVLHGMMVLAALGFDVPIERVVPVLIGALFLAMAWVMPGIRSNFMVGIRTPWTLSSEYSWRRTHEAGRWVFGAVGVALLVYGLFGTGEQLLIYVIVGAVASSLVLVAYSYAMWRADPQRHHVPPMP